MCDQAFIQLMPQEFFLIYGVQCFFKVHQNENYGLIISPLSYIPFLVHDGNYCVVLYLGDLSIQQE